MEALLGASESFVQEVQCEEAELGGVLATVLFIDVVGPPADTATLGAQGSRDVIERHRATIRAILRRCKGAEIDAVGDGFFSTFDGPARAVRCAWDMIDALRPLELEVRAGVHTGEVETIDGKAGGFAVAMGARIGRMARASEVLVSQTVKDLVAGSGLSFGTNSRACRIVGASIALSVEEAPDSIRCAIQSRCTWRPPAMGQRRHPRRDGDRRGRGRRVAVRSARSRSSLTRSRGSVVGLWE